MQKRRGLSHKLSEEQFGLIKSLSPNGMNIKVARAISIAINMSVPTVYRVSKHNTWAEFIEWKKNFAVRQREKMTGGKTLVFKKEEVTEETPHTEIKVANEIVAIRKLLETMVMLWSTPSGLPRKNL